MAAARVAQAAGARVAVLAGGLRGHVDTTTPNGVVATVARPASDAVDGAPGPTSGPALHLVLVGVGDPGNVGTLLRTAEAVGATLGRPLRRVGRPVGPEGGAGLGRVRPAGAGPVRAG